MTLKPNVLIADDRKIGSILPSRYKKNERCPYQGTGGYYLLVGYTRSSAQKGLLFKAAGMPKGRGICHFGLKGLTEGFHGCEKVQKIFPVL